MQYIIRIHGNTATIIDAYSHMRVKSVRLFNVLKAHGFSRVNGASLESLMNDNATFIVTLPAHAINRIIGV